MYLVAFAMEMREKTNTVKAKKKKTTRKESVWVKGYLNRRDQMIIVRKQLFCADRLSN